VIGYTDLLLNDPRIMEEKETAQGFLRTMNAAGHDASKIVARLRDFYRPREESEIFTPIDLAMLLEEVVPLTQPKWKTQALAAGRAVNVVLDLEPVPLVACNAAEIREIAVNLIFNAVDAMPEGGTMTLRTRHAGNVVSIGVSDTGTGMTEEVRQRCMEPFFSTKGEDGTGLGLSMVFGILKRHEGAVDIESEIGKGTTFWIRLPRSTEESEAAHEEDDEGVRSLHVLTVDDQPTARDVLTRYLRADSHSVVTATNGLEALAKFNLEPFDLVITDHAMPGMTGAQLATAIKEKKGDQPILLVTGYSDLNLSAADLPAGVDLIVSKAISLKELRQAIAKAIRNAEMGCAA
jgi:CheY-like chemotaxis protein